MQDFGHQQYHGHAPFQYAALQLFYAGHVDYASDIRPCRRPYTKLKPLSRNQTAFVGSELGIAKSNAVNQTQAATPKLSTILKPKALG